MNMNKALQNLYHAVSGSTTTKVNISKLLVDIHYAITGVESSVKNNWSRIIDSMATNWPEGGGGSSDFSTAEVTITNNTGNGVTCYVSYVGDIGSAVNVNIGDAPVTLSVILYQGNAGFGASNGTVSATGDIEVPPIPAPTCLIYGNGTITIS